MQPRVHVIGAGLSGLAAAVALAGRGLHIVVHEAAGHAGGRCRSYDDAALGRRIDNGNHLVLSGNTAIAAYLGAIGGTGGLIGPTRAEFPFVDLASGERWTVRPNGGPLPWWILAPSRRVPGAAPRDYLRALRLARAGPGETVTDYLAEGAAFSRFWEPLAVAVLNTEPDHAAASLLWPVLRETFGRGEGACRPRLARDGLSECFVEPALVHLGRAGGAVHRHHRLRRIEFTENRVSALCFGDDDPVRVGERDGIVLAVPPLAAAALVPDLTVPQGSRAIVNGHFLLPDAGAWPLMLGLVGGLCHWLFVRGDVASVTISAADDAAELSADRLAEAMWADVARALDLGGQPLPAHRIVKEKRATFAQTPEDVARRPKAQTRYANLVLAGDWTDTGLPATLEGSVRAGNTAAAAIRKFVATP